MIYFDAAAAAPLHDGFKSFFDQYLETHPIAFHAKSLHEGGRVTRGLMDEAEEALLQSFFSDAYKKPQAHYSVQFFSSGSEALQQAIVALSPHEWIHTKGEHAALRDQTLERLRGISIQSPSNPNTPVTISTIYGQNEIGEISPLSKASYLTSHIQNPNFIIDCVASWGKSEIFADLIFPKNALFVVQAGKLGGWSGSGALIYPKSLSLSFPGNSHKHYLTALSFLYFARKIKESISLYQNQIQSLRDFTESHLTEIFKDKIEWTHQREPSFENRLPHLTHFSVKASQPLHLVQKLDLNGFCVSSGSACSSLSPEPSPVLLERGWSKVEALNAIRLSFSKENTKEEVLLFSETLKKLL